MPRFVLVPVSPAELMDKIAILQVKERNIQDPVKLNHVRRELHMLNAVFRKNIRVTKKLDTLIAELKKTSLKGWSIESVKRDCERRKDFGPAFIKAARGAFKNNDARARLWGKINRLMHSEIFQEKSYE